MYFQGLTDRYLKKQQQYKRTSPTFPALAFNVVKVPEVLFANSLHAAL